MKPLPEAFHELRAIASKFVILSPEKTCISQLLPPLMIFSAVSGLQFFTHLIKKYLL
ncbi:hypothetical protein [Pantoea piersonii]|uniref:hypothetical protein n=1 Tax=Pantoea piersonii TaxID=2364647 RepID=UPI0028B0486E|nr:hypothetical protein [Pantoea piersonii]